MKLEDLQPNAAVRGIIPDALVPVGSVQWFGSGALELTCKTPAGKVSNELVYRHDEPRLEVVERSLKNVRRKELAIADVRGCIRVPIRTAKMEIPG